VIVAEKQDVKERGLDPWCTFHWAYKWRIFYY